MRRQLAGQRVLITGASSGIGRSLAELAAQAGMRLLLAGRSHDTLDQLTRTLTDRGHTAFAEPVDVTVAEDRQRLFQAVQERLGGLDVLINNAGIGAQGL